METICCIGIINGYVKNSSDKLGDRFLRNGRVKSAILLFSDGTQKTIELLDSKKMQYFEISPSKLTTYIRVKIGDAYPNSKLQNIAISEIHVWGK